MTEQSARLVKSITLNSLDHRYYSPAFLFVIALIVRLMSIPLALTRINPYSTSDAIGFANAAELIAHYIRSGRWPASLPTYSTTYERWGLILSPFWLLPGPSELYAHIFVAFLGSIAVYNVAALTQYYHSQKAGLFASLPLALYPTIILTHASLLREAAVLFGITTAVRLLVAPPQRLSNRYSVLLSGLCLGLAAHLRPENVALYIGAIGVGILLILLRSRDKYSKGLLSVLLPIGGLFVARYSSFAVDYALSLRDKRARGRAAYLTNVNLEGGLDVVAFSWVGASYFLYSPFPWMISQFRDYIVCIESLISIGFTVSALIGFPIALHKDKIGSVTLLIAFFAGVVFYGFATANVGAAARHRPMFLWIIFIFGGIGLAELQRIAENKS